MEPKSRTASNERRVGVVGRFQSKRLALCAVGVAALLVVSALVRGGQDPQLSPSGPSPFMGVEEETTGELLRERAVIARALAEASEEFGVPLPILKAIAYVESHWSHRIPRQPAPEAADCPGCGARIHEVPSYGVMGLRNDEHFGRSLAEAAYLIGESMERLKNDPVANIRGAAALLAALANQERERGHASSRRLEAWKGVVERYSGFKDPESAELFAIDVFRVLERGVREPGIHIEAHPDLDMSIFKKKGQVGRN
jgi:hypothetical protein